MADQISPATASDFESSPAGTTISLTRKPAASATTWLFK